MPKLGPTADISLRYDSDQDVLQGMKEYYKMWLHELKHHLNPPSSDSQSAAARTTSVKSLNQP